MLYPHIVDFQIDQGAEPEPFLNHAARVIGVHMDLDDVVVVHADHAVPHALQVGPELHGVRTAGRLIHNELRAVAELNLPAGLRQRGQGLGGGPGLLRLDRLNHLAGLEHALHPLENVNQALTARVHNPGLFQHRQLLRRMHQSLPGGGEDLSEHNLGIVCLPGALRSPLRGHPGHGENGAFGGLHHRLIGGVHPNGQRLGQILAAGLGLPLQALGKAPEQQGEDHARVAPGSPQEGRSRNLRRLFHRWILQKLQLPLARANGHGHISAGIPVGNREHVQLVHRLLPIGNIVGAGDHGLCQYASFYHVDALLCRPKRAQ